MEDVKTMETMGPDIPKLAMQDLQARNKEEVLQLLSIVNEMKMFKLEEVVVPHLKMNTKKIS